MEPLADDRRSPHPLLPDLPEVVVERMEMIFEVQGEGSSPWQRLDAVCTFDPPAPVLVTETQVVEYDCQLGQGPPSEAELRTTVEIKLLGSDELFQLQVQE